MIHKKLSVQTVHIADQQCNNVGRTLSLIHKYALESLYIDLSFGYVEPKQYFCRVCVALHLFIFMFDILSLY